MIKINRDPSPSDVRVFGGLCLVFFGVLGGVALWRPRGFLVASAILGAAWLTSLVFNRTNRREQLLGLLLPGLLGLAGAAVRVGVSPWSVALVSWAGGLLAAGLAWAAARGAGKKLYVGWILAAAPIGWTISHLVLGIVYYGVLTPIGLAMRAMGRDPMRRRFEPGAESYWIERPARPDPLRHFRQF